MAKQTPLQRFMSKIIVNAETNCWEWNGCTDQDGYGRFKVDGRNQKAYRWILSQAIGSLDGLEADHLCCNRKCCNPVHLEAVSGLENKLRISQPHRRSALHIERDLSHLEIA